MVQTKAKPAGVAKGFDMTLPELLRATQTHFGVTEKQLFGRNTHKDVVYARSIMMYIMRHLFKLSLTLIAHVFRRHHTTVLSALNKITPKISDIKSAAFRDAEAVVDLLHEHFPRMNLLIGGLLFCPSKEMPRA